VNFVDALTAAPVVDLEEYRQKKLERERRQRLHAQGKVAKAAAREVERGKTPDRLFEGYKPHAKQRELHEARTRYVVVCAGRRSGKTYAVGREFLRRAFEDLAKWEAAGNSWEPPAKLGPETKPAKWYWAVAPTYQMGTYQRQEIFEVLGGEDSPLVLHYHRQHNTLWLVGGIRIEFRSADRPNNLVGSGLDGIWIDEAARLKQRAWDDNLRGTLSDKQGWGLFSSTPLGQNWFHQELWQRTQQGTEPELRSSDWYGVHWTSAQNTALPHLVEEAQKAKAELPRAIYLRNYAASFSAFEGKVFEAFMDTAPHVVDRVPFKRIVRKIAGVDWGHGNPGTQVEIGITATGEMYVYREDYERRLPVADPSGAKTGRSWMAKFRSAKVRGVSTWWADPSGAGYIQQCQLEGLQFRKADNAVQEGIDALAAMLEPAGAPGEVHRPALFIHRGCQNLRRELLTYHYKDGSDSPEKVDDHAVDALRYAIYSEHMRRRADGGEGLPRLTEFSIFDPGRKAA